MELIRIVTGGLFTNTYLIIEDGRAVVIDPGADFERIQSRLAEKHAHAECVLITHGHFDHVGAVAAFNKAGAKVYISETDYSILKNSDFDVDLGLGQIAVEPFDADVLLNGGETLDILGHKFEVVSTPGHSSGGLCYILDGKTIFTGDTLFNATVGRTDLKYADFDELMSSLDKLFALDGNYDVLPGHGNPTSLDFERKHNPYARNIRH